MKRVLVIPAAGRGSRLQSDLPKPLHPVAGRPMLDWLWDLHAEWTAAVVLVLHPQTAPAIQRHCRSWSVPISVAVQHEPRGMVDALLQACDAVADHRPDRVWVTWCDQVAVAPATVAALAREEAAHPDMPLILPTVACEAPYVHFERDASGTIAAVRHRREGDAMPARGEADSGLFSFSPPAFTEELPRFARTGPRGARTGEANFLPFVARMAATDGVLTLPAGDAIEAVGVNDAADQRRVEAHLLARTTA